MRDYLINLFERMGHWGYALVFIAVMLECQPPLGLMMAGETIVLVSGFLASEGVFELDTLIIVIACAAIVGDTIGYELGRWLGKDWLLRHGRWVGIRERHLQQIDQFFARHGGKAAFASHFMHLMRALVPFVAGSVRMRYRVFLVFNTAGCIAWAAIFATLGYLLGESWIVAEKWIGRGGVILGGFLLLVLGFAWFWRWIIRHEEQIKDGWQAALAHPRVAQFRKRFAPQLEWLLERLSPQGYLGLHLTVGTLVLIAACWLFAGITEDILTGDPLTVVDRQFAAFLHRHATPGLTKAMETITLFGSTAFLTGATLVLAMTFAWQKFWYWLLNLLLVMPGGALLNILLKHSFGRARPWFENPLVTLSGFSFPSGHTMGATHFYGLLAIFAAVMLQRWRWRTLAVLAAFFFVLLIGFSRIYLGAHYLSDVLGAGAAGIAWLTLCLTAVETFCRGYGSKQRRFVK